MKSLTSGKLFTFKGVTYRVKRTPKSNSIDQVGCAHCNRREVTMLFGNTLCQYCADHLDCRHYPIRVYKKDEMSIDTHIKNALNAIESMEKTEVIERIKRFGYFTDRGIKSEYVYRFKRPVQVTIQKYPFNGDTKVTSVIYRPHSEVDLLFNVGLYSAWASDCLTGETIITEHVGKFCPGDTIKIALAIK